MNFKRISITLIAFLLVFVNLSQAQIKVIAAPGNMKNKAKKNFPIQNLPEVDTDNIYKELLNDLSDDLMENHPAYDIYNDSWSSSSINPYNVSLSNLPDSFVVDLSGFVSPVEGGRVSSNFGPRRYRYHYGIDIAIPIGTPIVSSFDGKVRIIRNDPRGYGNYIVVRHDNGLETVYAHLSKIKVELNEDVKAGELIAFSGNTGRSTGPHLHFETRFVGNAFNPANIIDFNERRVYADNYTLTKRVNFGYQQQKASSSQMARYYKVKSGDTLGRIASRNRTTVAKLKSLNRNINPNKLRVGQRIRIS